MNKTNELMEKAIARARVKGQPRVGVGSVVTRRPGEEIAEETPGSVREKRIDSAGGRVVVRRRGRPQTSTSHDEGIEDLSIEAQDPASFAGMEPEPMAEAPEPVALPSRVEAPVEPVVSAPAVEMAAVPPAPEPIVAAPVAALPEPEPAHVVAEVVPEPVAPAPPEPAPARAAAADAEARRRRAVEPARVIYRPPPAPAGGPASRGEPMEQRRIASSPPDAARDRERSRGMEEPREVARRRVETPRSLEDVLAEERGYVPTVHRAMVVAPPAEERAASRRQPPPAPPAPAAATAAAAPATAAAGFEEAKRGKHPYKTEAFGPSGLAGTPPNGRAAGKKGKKERGGARRGSVGTFEPDFAMTRRRKAAGKKSGKKTVLTTPKAAKRVVEMDEVISVGDLAHQMSVKAAQVIKKLMSMGMMATLNQLVDFDTATIVASDFEYEVRSTAFDESEYIPDVEDDDESMEWRAPVVTIMGHVDHGKTTLLDRIRSTDVAGGEAGGITQHIGAYKVNARDQAIVFLDTPGHEAFTAMRARGAEVTDIVVLVVAADDGVMPQTVEAINHAQAADVPIIVAVNKIDKPGANPEVVQRMLADHGLVPEAWGGNTIYCYVSAKEGTGIPELLDMILLQAEVLELVANPDRGGRAAVIEAELDKGRGPVATVLVQTGTLRVGDYVVAGAHYGKVRAMFDEHGHSHEAAGPSTPVQILGLSGVPEAGDQMAVVEDQDTARAIADERATRMRQKALAGTPKASLDDLMRQMKETEPEEVRLVVKTDVHGSLEALCRSFENLTTDKVKVNIISSGVGAISESDITLAQASDAVVIGFNVQPDNKAAAVAEQAGVLIKTHSIIYEAMDDLRLLMTGKLAPVFKERILGHAEVRDLFSIPRVGVIAGCMVTDGKIQRNSMGRLLRGGKTIWEGRLTSLKRFKDDAREVEKGFECGIGLDNYNELQPADVIESYTIDEIAPTL